MDRPLILAIVCFIVLCVSARIGSFARKKRSLDEAEIEDLGVITAANLTLLALIIGFAFSMAVTRYDQRKLEEAAEANAIGTEYARAGLLRPPEPMKIRALLKSYLDERILFYTTRDVRQLERIDADTMRLQSELW